MGTSFTEKKARAGLMTSTVVAKNGKWTNVKHQIVYIISVGKQIMLFLDFGGQSLFREVHQLFLTSYGVYIVVFNMLDMFDDNKKEKCLTDLLLDKNDCLPYLKRQD